MGLCSSPLHCRLLSVVWPGPPSSLLSLSLSLSPSPEKLQQRKLFVAEFFSLFLHPDFPENNTPAPPENRKNGVRRQGRRSVIFPCFYFLFFIFFLCTWRRASSSLCRSHRLRLRGTGGFVLGCCWAGDVAVSCSLEARLERSHAQAVCRQRPLRPVSCQLRLRGVFCALLLLLLLL